MKARCPYRGLQPLSREDQPFFAGREKEVQVVLSNIYGSSLTVLYGESGVGKTSLIRAGLLPALEADKRAAGILFRDWQRPDFERRLRDEVLQALLASINRARSAHPDEASLSMNKLKEAFCVGLELPSPEELYTLPFHRFIQESSAAFYGKVFFIFDQFEEYIYYHPLESDGYRFDTALASAINDRQISASFLLSLREDGLGKLDRLRGRIPDLLGNIVRLEHLDRAGAQRAIEKPLEIFSEGKTFAVEAAPELKETLLEQVNADRLETDESEETDGADLRRGDGGARYKVVALQAVLTQLWDADVEPLLGRKGTLTGVVRLKLETLCTLTKNKKEPDETEVHCLVRTYFDEKLKLINHDEAEAATEILRGLVRGGGHKRARTVQSLAKETALSKEKVEAVLINLSSEPFTILRALKGNKETLYELNHDVMSFAIMDWSNRQRLGFHEEELRHRRRRRLTLGLLVTSGMILIGAAFMIAHVQRLKKEITDQASLVTQKQAEIDELSKRQAVIVEYFANPADIDNVAQVLKRARFLVTAKAPSPPALSINTLLYGKKAKLDDVKALAIDLIDAGIGLRMIDTIKGARASEALIQLVGTSAAAHDAVLTTSQIESLAPTQGPDGAGLAPVSTAGAKALLFVSESQRDAVSRVVAVLKEVDYTVPAPLGAGDGQPIYTQIRYFRVNDKAEADFLAKLLAPFDREALPNYLHDPQNSARTTPVFEIWLGPKALAGDANANDVTISRIFIHAGPKTTELAQKLRARLEASGAWVSISQPSQESVLGRIEYSDRAPEDATEAATLLGTLKQLGVSPLAETPEPAKIESRPRRFEIYLPKVAN